MKELIGKKIKFYLKNNYIFRGKVLSQDERFVEILDTKLNKPVTIALDEISNFEEGVEVNES